MYVKEPWGGISVMSDWYQPKPHGFKSGGSTTGPEALALSSQRWLPKQTLLLSSCRTVGVPPLEARLPHHGAKPKSRVSQRSL